MIRGDTLLRTPWEFSGSSYFRKKTPANLGEMIDCTCARIKGKSPNM